MKRAFTFLATLSVVGFSIGEIGSTSDSFSNTVRVSASNHLIFSSANNDVDKSLPPVKSFLNEGKETFILQIAIFLRIILKRID